ncbi:MAG: thiamine diphosphokinase [Lachnospiraceae bacterium]|nr:thiamine diphosphokinase [Lachnospiraceae bacterium]
MNKCFIVGAGDFFGLDVLPDGDDYIIAADGGYDYLERLGIHPDLVIGDFDSRSGEIPEHENILELPVMKDDTDIGAAVCAGFEKGYTEFHIYGGTGGSRFSHTMANIQLLANIAEQGGRGFLYGQTEISTVILDSEFVYPAQDKGYISVFSLSDASEGVSIKGLKYELEDATLKNTFALGVSNEFKGEEVSIKVDTGTLLIVYEKEL